MASAKTTSANLADASAGLKEMIGENRVGLRHSLASIEQSVTSARELMDNQIVQLLTNANTLVTDMKGVVHDNQGAVKAAVADLRQASRSFKDVAREVRQKPSRLLYGASAGERKLP